MAAGWLSNGVSSCVKGRRKFTTRASVPATPDMHWHELARPGVTLRDLGQAAALDSGLQFSREFKPAFFCLLQLQCNLFKALTQFGRLIDRQAGA